MSRTCHPSAPRHARSALAAALGVAVASLASAGAPADLFIAGDAGSVWKADAVARSFTYFTCSCNGPIQGVVQAGDNLFVADSVGLLFTFSMTDALPINGAFLGAGATAMVMDGDDLIIAGVDRNIRRVDAATGLIESWRISPIDVDAMVIAEGRLFIGGATGDVWSAPVDSGDFNYFACACFPGVRSLAAHNGSILIGAENGIFLSVRISDSAFNFGQIMPTTLRAMAMHGPDLLAAGADSQVHRINPDTGDILDSTPAPFIGDALVVGSFIPNDNPSDLNDDGAVNTHDLSMLLGSWGACPGDCVADINEDAFVNHTDLALLLGAWS